MSFKIYKLSDICNISIGKTPYRDNKVFWGEGYPWISIADMNGSLYVTKTKEQITSKAVKECNCREVPENTLLMSFKLSIGKLAFTSFPAYTNEAIAALIIKDENIVYSKFLYYALKVVNLLETTDKAVKGLTLNKAKLQELKIPLPPLETQKQIANVLDKADELRQKRKQANAKLDEFLQSVFLDMFGDPAKNEKQWDRSFMDSVITYMADIGSNGSNEVVAKNLKMSDEENYALMIRTVNLNANDFTENIKYISEDAYNFYRKSKVYGGELIMCKIGSAGKFWIMPNLNRPVSLGLNQFLIRLKDINLFYIYYFLKTEFGQYHINKSLRGAVTQSITKSAVRELPILLPPLELQNEFAKIFEKVEDLKKKNEASAIKLDDLFNSLLQRAFKGELEFRDSVALV